ncbi:MAG: hypothetical protein Q8S01_11820, partial [Ignavibacteria bacterium]|nr:hypothetical protein [Ignavibacteria bacterium]
CCLNIEQERMSDKTYSYLCCYFIFASLKKFFYGKFCLSRLSMVFTSYTKVVRLIILLLIGEPYSRTFAVKGNITTADSTHVKYATIIFSDESDTTKKHFAITDSSGNYYLA